MRRKVAFTPGCFASEGAAGWGGSPFPARRGQLGLGDRVIITVQAGAELAAAGDFELVVRR